jgi:hypothetical protein
MDIPIQKSIYENRIAPEHTLIQTAIGNALRRIAVVLPNGVSLDTIEDTVTAYLGDDAMQDWEDTIIDYLTQEKIKSGNPSYIFWDTVIHAYEGVLGYNPGIFYRLLSKDEFTLYLGKEFPIVMKISYTKPQDTTLYMSIVTVYKVLGGVVYYTDPKQPIEPSGCRDYSIPFEAFWKWADNGGDVHQGIVFKNSDRVFSPHFHYDAEHPPSPTESVLSILDTIKEDRRVADEKQRNLFEDCFRAVRAGGDAQAIGTGICQYAEDSKKLIMCDEYHELVIELLDYLYSRKVILIEVDDYNNMVRGS